MSSITATEKQRAAKASTTILLVDDDTKSRKMMSRYLVMAGYGRCDEAVDGQRAVDMVADKVGVVGGGW
jgi:PleD family two-component response regulator